MASSLHAHILYAGMLYAYSRRAMQYVMSRKDPGPASRTQMSRRAAGPHWAMCCFSVKCKVIKCAVQRLPLVSGSCPKDAPFPLLSVTVRLPSA